MNDLALHAETMLRTHPHPALRLAELVELLAERYDPSVTAERLRLVLEDHPCHFSVLEAWNGRWPSAHADEIARDAWVVIVTDPAVGPDQPRPAQKLRESVRWLARGVDPRSRLEVSRWYAIALSERSAREAVTRRAMPKVGREAA